MYDVVAYKIPKGSNYSECTKELVRNIRAGKDVEDSKDKLFRMTYALAIQELKKYAYIGTPDDLLPDMSIAFMNTLNHFDPDKPGASFVNYYKLAIKTEIINRYYGKFKNKKEWMDGYSYFLNGTRSLHELLYDKNDVETGTLADTIVDDSVDIEGDIEHMALVEVINNAIEEIFKSNKKLKKRGKDIFSYYIEHQLRGEEITQLEVGKKFNASRGNVSNIMALYKPKLMEILKREGIL